MSNSNNNASDQDSRIEDLMRKEEDRDLFKDDASLQQTFYLLEKNAEAIREQIQKKDERLKRQDRQINDLCSRIREILDKDVENSLLEDFEEGDVFSEKSREEIIRNYQSKTQSEADEKNQESQSYKQEEGDRQEVDSENKEEDEISYDDFKGDVKEDQYYDKRYDNGKMEERKPKSSKKFKREEDDENDKKEEDEPTSLWNKFRQIIKNS